MGTRHNRKILLGYLYPIPEGLGVSPGSTSGPSSLVMHVLGVESLTITLGDPD